MKVRGGFCGALLAASACGLFGVSSAGAKTFTVGQLFTPNVASCNPGKTVLQTGVASGNSYTVPKAGVITSWSWHDGAHVVPDLKLKVGRSTAVAGSYKIIGEATAGTQTPNAVHTYHAHIRVLAGDLIGIYENGGSCGSGTGNPMDTDAETSGDVPPGMTAPFDSFADVKWPVSVKVALCVVPKLVGKTLAAAKDALADATCGLGKVTKIESSGTPGIVFSQNPKPGTQLPGFAKVAVVVSSR